MLGSMLDCEFLTRQDVGRQLTAMPNQVYLIRLMHSVRRRLSGRLRAKGRSKQILAGL